MIKYPIGIHTFEGIRREKFVYVDKTELVYRLKRGGRHYLLCRPRLFGKSLLLSTIQSYFKGEKELFQGLRIADLEKRWHKHAVLKFDFQVPFLVKEEARATALDKLIDSQLNLLERLYGHDESERTIKDRFLGIIERSYQASPRGVVVLIDNYDSPLLATLDEPAILNHYVNLLTQFYSVLPLALDKIRFSFICGITAIGKSSFLKDFVYTGSELTRSCRLKSHHKRANAPSTTAAAATAIRLPIPESGVPTQSNSDTASDTPSDTTVDDAQQANYISAEPESDSPFECLMTSELNEDSTTPSMVSLLPVMPETKQRKQSRAQLVSDDNSITATNADSRFAATASEDFIPIDADPSVKVIFDPTDVKTEPEDYQKDPDKASTLSANDKNVFTSMSLDPNSDFDSDTKTNANVTEQPLSKEAAINNCQQQSMSAIGVTAIGVAPNTAKGFAFIRDISLDSAFTGLCGFSENEILENMRPGLERLARYKESDEQSVLEAFSRRYYGYHFNIKGWGKFNPYDVFNALSQDRIGDFWCSEMRESGIKDLVISKIMTTVFDMRLLKECKIPKSELEQDPFLSDSPIPLLYQCGYLTIMGHGPKDKLYYLTLSNKEVREEFLSELLNCYGCFHHQKNNYITAMLEDLQNGFPEIFVMRMKSFFQDPDDAGACSYYPQTSALKMTNFPLYYQNLLYLVFTLLSKDVLESFGQEIGYEINDGNAELIMQFDHSIYIFEFVLDQDMNSALGLLQERHLQAPVIFEDKEIVKVCVSVSSELRNISSWFVKKDESPEYQSDGDQASAFPLFSPHNL